MENDRDTRRPGESEAPHDAAAGDLEEDRYWDEADEELPPRRRRRLLTPLTGGMALALVAACGFIAGALVEKGQTSTSAAPGAGFARRAAALIGGAAAGGGRGAGAGGFGGSAVVGQVATVRGNTLYVVDQQGNTLKVATVKGGTVTRTTGSRLRSIHPGDSVVVQGSRRGDGTIAATSVRSTAASLGGGALGQLFGGAQGGAPAGGAAGSGAPSGDGGGPGG